MIRASRSSHKLMSSIPRESGDDPQDKKERLVEDEYSPRERG